MSSRVLIDRFCDIPCHRDRHEKPEQRRQQHRLQRIIAHRQSRNHGDASKRRTDKQMKNKRNRGTVSDLPFENQHFENDVFEESDAGVLSKNYSKVSLQKVEEVDDVMDEDEIAA